MKKRQNTKLTVCENRLKMPRPFLFSPPVLLFVAPHTTRPCLLKPFFSLTAVQYSTVQRQYSFCQSSGKEEGRKTEDLWCGCQWTAASGCFLSVPCPPPPPRDCGVGGSCGRCTVSIASYRIYCHYSVIVSWWLDDMKNMGYCRRNRWTLPTTPTRHDYSFLSPFCTTSRDRNSPLEVGTRTGTRRHDFLCGGAVVLTSLVLSFLACLLLMLFLPFFLLLLLLLLLWGERVEWSGIREPNAENQSCEQHNHCGDPESSRQTLLFVPFFPHLYYSFLLEAGSAGWKHIHIYSVGRSVQLLPPTYLVFGIIFYDSKTIQEDTVKSNPCPEGSLGRPFVPYTRTHESLVTGKMARHASTKILFLWRVAFYSLLISFLFHCTVVRVCRIVLSSICLFYCIEVDSNPTHKTNKTATPDSALFHTSFLAPPTNHFILLLSFSVLLYPLQKTGNEGTGRTCLCW